MCWNTWEPRVPGCLLFGFTGYPAGHKVVDDCLFLLLQQADQFLLRADVALDASVHMVEEAGDVCLLLDGRKRHRQFLELVPVDVNDREASPHPSLLDYGRSEVRCVPHVSTVESLLRAKYDDVPATIGSALNQVDGGFPDLVDGFARRGEENVPELDRRVVAGPLLGDVGPAVPE